MSSDRPDARNEHGVALVMAMLVLLCISLLAVVLMATVNTETKIVGHERRESSALNSAEAGIAEAMGRISNGDINFGTNPRGTAVIFNTASGSVPVMGVDTTGLATAQPAGAWLSYSTPAKSPDALIVSYKTDAGRTVIYKYDPSKNPQVQTLTGNPIYSITSTGRSGLDRRTIVAEVIQNPLVVNMKGALCTNVDVKFTGNAWACGYNHRADTPYDTGSNGRSGAGGCNENSGIQHWEVGSGDLTGIWCGGAINSGGASSDAGVPSGELAGQAGFYAGPWEALGMTQSEFYTFVGAPKTSVPGTLDGITYLDDNGIKQDHSGSYSITGTGSGLLYVDGDLTMNSGFTWRGLIYVEGDIKLNGHSWILGGVVVKGVTSIKFNGGATILFSQDAISQNISKAKGQFVTLSWREL